MFVQQNLVESSMATAIGVEDDFNKLSVKDQNPKIEDDLECHFKWKPETGGSDIDIPKLEKKLLRDLYEKPEEKIETYLFLGYIITLETDTYDPDKSKEYFEKALKEAGDSEDKRFAAEANLLMNRNESEDFRGLEEDRKRLQEKWLRWEDEEPQKLAFTHGCHAFALSKFGHNKEDAAIEQYGKAIEFDPENWKWAFGKAKTLERKRDFHTWEEKPSDETVKLFKKAKKLSHKDERVLAYFANCLVKLYQLTGCKRKRTKYWQKIKDLLQKASRKKKITVLKRCCKVYKELQWWDDFKNCFDITYAMATEDDSLFLHQGAQYYMYSPMKNPFRAKGYLERSVKCSPSGNMYAALDLIKVRAMLKEDTAIDHEYKQVLVRYGSDITSKAKIHANWAKSLEILKPNRILDEVKHLKKAIKLYDPRYVQKRVPWERLELICSEVFLNPSRKGDFPYHQACRDLGWIYYVPEPKTEDNLRNAEKYLFYLKEDEFEQDDIELYGKVLCGLTKYEAVPVEKLLLIISRQIGKEWKKIGLNLGILTAKLDRLEDANKRDLEGAIRDMLKYWWRKERFKKEQLECLALMKEALINSGRRDIADYAETFQGKLKDDPFYDDPVAKLGIKNFLDVQEISLLVVNIPATSVSPEDPMGLHYYFVEFGKLVFESWQKPDPVAVTSLTYSSHEFEMQNIALAYYLSYTNDQDIENGLDVLYSSCEKKNVDAVLPFCCQFSTETSEKVTQSRYKNLKVKQDDDLAKVSYALRKLADDHRLDSSEVNLISCTQLSTEFSREMEMLCSLKLLDRGERKPHDSIEHLKYRPELILINEQTTHLKQAWENNLIEPEAALVILNVTYYVGRTPGQVPSNSEYTSDQPLEKPFIGGENIPDIKSEKTSVSWLILKHVKSSAKLLKFVEKICKRNSHPLGVTIAGWIGSYDDLQQLFAILRRNGKVMHMCIDLSGVQFPVHEWVKIFEELDWKSINSLKLRKCDLKKEVLQPLMEVIFNSEFLYSLDIQENRELFTSLQQLEQRDFEDRQLSSLKILRIGGVYVPQLDVKKPVSEFLKLTPNMKELDVQCCVCDLVPEILQLQNITHLTMSRTSSRTIAWRVNGMDFEVLFKNLGKIPKLETLIAGWCSMGDDIIKVLATNMNQVPKLKVLTLCYNNITETGFIPLVNSMAQHAGIAEINVERNPVGKEGFETLMEQLGKLVNMKHLFLSKTLSLDRESGEKLCCNLVKCQSIETVELNGMGFDSSMLEGFPQLRNKIKF